jgi:predicted helicase
LDLKTGQTKILTNDSSVSEIVWLGSDDSILYVNGTNADIPGGVELWVTQASSFANGYIRLPVISF